MADTAKPLDRVLALIESRQQACVQELLSFLSIPSISANPAHKADVARCATWLAGRIQETGLQAVVMPTGGHPVVLARNEHRPDRPTVLVYGHYDVQPPEPLELWTTPPFDPAVRVKDGNPAVFARGAADDKGQVWTHVEAIRAWQQEGGAPVNLILLIEGEEEIGSEHLGAFVEEHKEELQSDIAVIADTEQFTRGIPAITYGLRGLVYEEVTLIGPNHDLHSGIYGGAAPNPANALCELLATLHDADGRVNIPGFYDDVVPLTAAERAAWAALPFDESAFAASIGVPFGNGEQGYTTLERRWARPTCDINGLTSGYQGHGAKTVIASRASAKVSMRLVPHQDPAKIAAAFEKALRERCPKNVTIEFARHSASEASLVPLDHPAMQLAAEALERGFGAKPVMMREGGSVPIVGLFQKLLGVATLLVGYGLPDDRVHSPNEKFDLAALYHGTRTNAVLYERLSTLRK